MTALFGPLTTGTADDGTGIADDRAWLTALLDAERALAVALARAGVIPAEAAQAITRACAPDGFDATGLGRQAVASGNPVVPLVRELSARVTTDFARYVHFGATSQDIMDTAASLVVARALGPIRSDLDGCVAASARLADEHRDTVMIGRTLMQHAQPTVFGLKCAGWMTALHEAADGLARVRPAVQLGGATGNLAAIGDADVPGLFAEELGLAAPVLPWHTDRTRVGVTAGALGVLAGVLGKIALDVTLMAQTEVAEVAESSGGGSSAMPHKRNPVRSVLITAAARRVPGLVATLLGAMAQEHERAAGAWHAEWETLSELLRVVRGATARTGDLLRGLWVDRDRMRANVDTTGGLVMTGAVAALLAPELGRVAANDLVAELAGVAADTGRPVRDVLAGDPRVTVPVNKIITALDPTRHLGPVHTLIDRALRHCGQRAHGQQPRGHHQPGHDREGDG